MMRLALFAAAALAVAAPAAATPADDLHRLMDEHYRWLLRENPTSATALGVHDYDNAIRDISPEARDRRAREAQAFLVRLRAIPPEPLAPADRVNRAILIRQLGEQVEENGFGQRDMLFTTYYGWHQGFTDLPRSLPFRTRADFDSYLARIAQYPRLNDQALAITANAVRGGYVLPCSVLGGYERTISGVISVDPTRSHFYEPFAGARPSTISEADWAALQARARTIVTTIINPAYQKHLDFYTHDYLPHCAHADGISAQPRGAEYYALQVREHTTTNLTPQQIHDIGLREVARIRAEMDRVAHDAGSPSREAFIRHLRTDPSYFPTSPAQLIAASAAFNKEVDYWLPRLFGRLPRLTFTIREIPAEAAEGTTTA
jgi:uncharacterized protein (DUF885 family)